MASWEKGHVTYIENPSPIKVATNLNFKLIVLISTRYSFAMYFRPILADGRSVALPWQVRPFFNRLVWPLQDNTKSWMQMADIFYVLVLLLIFLSMEASSLYFFVDNVEDLVFGTQAFLVSVGYNDVILRTLNMTMRKNSVKGFLKKFYREIYVDEKENHKINKKVKRSLTAVNISSVFYWTALVCYCLGRAVAAILYDSRPFSQQLQLPYNIESPLTYAFFLVLTTISCAYIISIVVGDLCLFGNFVGHLCERYSMLEEKLKGCELKLNKDLHLSQPEVMRMFRGAVRDAIKEAQTLNEFAKSLNEEYSFRLFSYLLHSSLQFCVIMFLASGLEFGSVLFLAYVGWMPGKFFELITYGELGSRLIDTTNNISSMFYHCNWEAIVFRSPDKDQNLLLMKEIQLAIQIFHDPLKLNGLGFFVLSLETVSSVMKVAWSYYTFLTAFE